MTAEQLIDGIAGAIYAEFGDGFTIYTENNQQDLSAPCFLISIDSNSNRNLLNHRYNHTIMANVVYFPSEGSADKPASTSKEMNDAADRILHCLEVITANDHKVRSTNRSTTVSDGSLVTTLDFDIHERLVINGDLMETENTMFRGKGK